MEARRINDMKNAVRWVLGARRVNQKSRKVKAGPKKPGGSSKRSKVKLGKKSQRVQKVGWSKESGEGKSQRVTKVI